MSLYKSIKKTQFNLIKTIYGTRAVPWIYYKIIQLILNTLFKKKRNTLSPDEIDLAELFDNAKLTEEIKMNIQLDSTNQWTLDYQVLNYLWDELNRTTPKVILEFGSGTSTKLAFQYFKRYPQVQFTLITIDQDAGYLGKTKMELGNTPKNVNFYPLFGPLFEKGYEIDINTLSKIIDVSGKIDMAIIDGPSGGWMVRENTLPSIINFCKNGCSWYLDDALRDSEMEILKKWKNKPQIKVDGICNVGKGIARGGIKNV